MAEDRERGPRKEKQGGILNKTGNAYDIEVEDFKNPWNFYMLFLQSDEFIIEWMRARGYLARSYNCPKAGCGGVCEPKTRAKSKCGQTMRCSKNRNHEYTINRYSFFSSHFHFADIFEFVKVYLDKGTLLQCSSRTGMDYRNTSVTWASYTREIMVEYWHRNIRNLVFSSDVEIDESLFGRACKYHRGNPNRGLHVWVFGIVEKQSNRIILYPVDKRDKDTLIPIIQRHVAPGTRIFSDGWASYLELNVLGYDHFSVIHKTSFQQVYENVFTEEKLKVDTNTIEGAWKHAKDHLKRINGTSMANFESHLCEIIFRNHAKGNLYVKFFEALKLVYTCDKPASYTYTHPIFGTSSAFHRESRVYSAVEEDVHTPRQVQLLSINPSSEPDEDALLDIDAVVDTIGATLEPSEDDVFHSSELSPSLPSAQKPPSPDPFANVTYRRGRVAKGRNVPEDIPTPGVSFSPPPLSLPSASDFSPDGSSALEPTNQSCHRATSTEEGRSDDKGAPNPSSSGATHKTAKQKLGKSKPTESSKTKKKLKGERLCYPTQWRPLQRKKKQKPAETAPNPYSSEAFQWSDSDFEEK